MKPSQLNKWLEKIYASKEEEISCSVCFELLDRYVDYELAGEPVRDDLAEVTEHLRQCQVCQEEYLLLRALAQSLEAEQSALS